MNVHWGLVIGPYSLSGRSCVALLGRLGPITSMGKRTQYRAEALARYRDSLVIGRPNNKTPVYMLDIAM